MQPRFVLAQFTLFAISHAPELRCATLWSRAAPYINKDDAALQRASSLTHGVIFIYARLLAFADARLLAFATIGKSSILSFVFLKFLRLHYYIPHLRLPRTAIKQLFLRIPSQHQHIPRPDHRSAAGSDYLLAALHHDNQDGHGDAQIHDGLVGEGAVRGDGQLQDLVVDLAGVVGEGLEDGVVGGDQVQFHRHLAHEAALDEDGQHGHEEDRMKDEVSRWQPK